MIVGLLGPGGCGGTFLDWTLHYLSCNDTNHVLLFNPATDDSDEFKEIKQHVVANPLKQSTAHLHVNTHPSNAQTLHKVVTQFCAQPSKLNTFYYVDSMQHDQKSTCHNAIIALYPDVKFIVYTFTPADIDAIFCLQYEKIATKSTTYDRDLNLYGLSLKEKWEKLSLYYPTAIRNQTYNEVILDHANSIKLPFQDMLYDLPVVIGNIFKFLNLTVDPVRYTAWLKLYHTWQERNNIKFYRDLDLITKNIVSNTAMDLKKYDMTFAKEVAVASRLLYHHNMSLKIEKAQVLLNTQDWHQLIETNVYHNLEQDKS